MANTTFTTSKLSLDDITDIVQSTVDPSASGYTAPVGSVLLRDTGELWIKVGATDTDWERIKSGTQVGVDQVASTGLLDGGELSINATNTLFDVAAGIGLIVDNYTDTLNPTAQLVSWGAQTALTVDNLATSDRSFIAINNAGSVVQAAEPGWSNIEHKDNIILGNLGHANRSFIVGLRNNPDPAIDATARLADLARAIGSFNISGNVFSPNGNNVFINKSSGITYRLGNNFANNKRDTDTNTDASGTIVPFLYSYQNGLGGHTLVTPATSAIDSNFYDDGSGTLAAMPNGRWQVQIIKYFSGISGAATTRIEYGQQTFSTKAAALDILPDANHVHNPAFAEGVIRGYLVVSANATDLSDLAEAEFIEAAKFGGGGGEASGSVTTLQQAYDNSTNPEITTDVTRGALTITEGAAVGGSLITAIDDGATTVFDVDVAGNLTATLLTQISDVNIVTPSDNDVLTYSAGTWVAAPPPGAGGGEANTASNVGTGGISIVDGKVGVDLQFKSINAASNKVVVTDDVANNNVDIDVAETNIVHDNLSGAGTNTHAQIDTHIADATLHFTEASIDHTAITNVGTNTHAQIDTHIADASVHFTQAAISITESQISDLQSYSLTTHNHTLDSLSNVTITGNTANEILKWSGTAWINNTLAEADIASATTVSNLQLEVDNIETASGGIFDAAGDYEATVLDALTNVTASTSLADALSQLDSAIGAGGTDESVKVSVNDTTAGYLNGKLIAGAGITLTENNDGANETLTVAAAAAAPAMADITDVDPALAPTDGHTLWYNQTNGQWESHQTFVTGQKQTIQSVFGTIPSLSGTSEIPVTTTTPLITDGSQIWSSAFTPTAADAEIKITISFAFTVSNAAQGVVATLFRDGTCIGAMSDSAANSDDFQTISFTVKDPGPFVAGVPVTYQMRFGRTGGNVTWYLNTNSGGEDFGTVLANNAYTIEEVVIL